MTSNPMTQGEIYRQNVCDGEPMTAVGAVNKTIILLAVTAVTAIYTWMEVFAGHLDKAQILMWIGIIAGVILAFVMRAKPQNAKILSIAYAVCEGMAIGGISAVYESQFHGIVANAALGTFTTLFVMLFLYKAGVIKATDTFRRVITTATFSIMIFYLVSIVISFFNPNFVAAWHNGMLGIGISVAICAVAALNFILDFNFIERGQNEMAPKYFEWYGAFALLVTIIWLYLEILRLLAMLNRNK